MKIIYYNGSGKRGSLEVLHCDNVHVGHDGTLLADVSKTKDDFMTIWNHGYEIIPITKVVCITDDDVYTSFIKNLPDIIEEGWETV